MTFCGLFVALSVSLRFAVRFPVTVGAKVIENVQLAPALSVVPQVVLEIENWLALVPVMLQERLTSAPVPVLERVSVLVCLLFRLTFPKLRLAGLRLTVGELTVCETVPEELPVKLLSPA